MILRNTIKWELRKYYYRVVGLCTGFLILAWGILLLMPVPGAHWNEGFRAIAFAVMVATALIAALVGLYMILVHPFTTSFCDLHKATLMEHQTARPYSYKLYIRLALNVITYLLGVGVLWVTMLLLQRFEVWVDRDWFSNMLADSPVILLPMISMFALGTPLVLLFGYKFFDVALTVPSAKTDWMDIAGFLIANAISGLFLLTERIFEWLPFAPALAVMITVNLALTIISVILISRFIDRFSEVTV